MKRSDRVTTRQLLCSITTGVAIAVAAALPQPAAAQRGEAPYVFLTEPAAVPVVELLPRPGAYYTSEASGSGLLLDVSEDGLVFGAFFYTREDGQRDWFTVAGMHQPSDVATWISSGETGRLVAARLETTGGPSGFNLPGGPGHSAAAEGPPVQLTWFGPERVQVEWSGRTLMLGSLAAVNPAVPQDDRILGEWRVTVIRTSGYSYVDKYTGVVQRLEPRPHELALAQVSIEAVPEEQKLRFFAAAPLATPVPDPSWKQYLVKTRGGVLGRATGSNERYDWFFSATRNALAGRSGGTQPATWGSPQSTDLVPWVENTFGGDEPWTLRRSGRVVFDPANGHRLQQHCNYEGCTRVGSDGTLEYQIKEEPSMYNSNGTVRFYFLNHNRMLAREFRHNSAGQIELAQELIFDRVTPGIEQQLTVGCARVASNVSTGFHGIFRCGHGSHNQWP